MHIQTLAMSNLGPKVACEILKLIDFSHEKHGWSLIIIIALQLFFFFEFYISHLIVKARSQNVTHLSFLSIDLFQRLYEDIAVFL